MGQKATLWQVSTAFQSCLYNSHWNVPAQVSSLSCKRSPLTSGEMWSQHLSPWWPLCADGLHGRPWPWMDLSWAIYLGYLFSEVFLEGSQKLCWWRRDMYNLGTPSFMIFCYAFLLELRGPAWAVGNYSICPPAGEFLKHNSQNITNEGMPQSVHSIGHSCWCIKM